MCVQAVLSFDKPSSKKCGNFYVEITTWAQKTSVYGIKYLYIKSTTVYPLVGIEYPPTPLPQASVPSPPDQRVGGTHSPAAKGVGESQFRRLEKKLSTLPAQWYTVCLAGP